jgi:nitrogen fixation protein FixH
MPTELQPPRLSSAPAKPAVEIHGGHVLAGLISFFLVVASVNGFMMYSAISTMPGLDAGRNGYDVSQRYNGEIRAAEAQAARGWSTDAELIRTGAGVRAAITFSDASGEAVDGLVVRMLFAHPADRRQDRSVTLAPLSQGRYAATVDALPAGAWDITIQADRDSARLYQSRGRKQL